ncbi:MAG: hypothetical protein A2204_03160 [Elusimicrobia bacterium RIFOXYA1_FULL_47_7]|nr:MAG: hypothetical protein A2204_03160 [Elusimicrobia bacterium RIFOXYA1_FULL_47_7]
MRVSKLYRVVLSLVALLLMQSVVFAGVKQINVQGKLTNNAGNPITGTHTLYFTLYDTLSGGSPLWADAYGVDLGSTGLYNVALATSSANSLDGFAFDKQYYIGISIDGQSEMTPRQKLNSAPYALGSMGDFNVGQTLTVLGDMSIAPTRKLSLDGGALAHPSYITEWCGDNIKITCGGEDSVYFGPTGFAVPSGKKLYVDSGGDTYFVQGNLPAGNYIDVYTGGIMRHQFRQNGQFYASGGFTTTSPNIRKDERFKDKQELTKKDYLDWALIDAKKPLKPYDGLPAVSLSTGTLKLNEFRTSAEADAELEKYSKDISKIAIGTCIWADGAEARLLSAEQEIAALKAEIELLKTQINK